MKGKKSLIAASAKTTSPQKRSSWTFLTNHAHVVILLKMHPQMILREIARHVGITERAVQKIILELEREGFIKKNRVGRQNRYTLYLNRPLRHQIEKHRTVADIVEMITE